MSYSCRNKSSSSSGGGGIWTARQNKQFEEALALHDRDSPDRWQKVARVVGKSVEDVKKHYDHLLNDVRNIESGKVPFPINYR